MDKSAARGQEGVSVVLIAEDGDEMPLGATNSSGNLAAASVPRGRFLIRTATSCPAGASSPTWPMSCSEETCSIRAVGWKSWGMSRA